MSIFDGQAPGHDALTLFIMQVLLIVVLCRTLAYLFGFLKQPPVIAEVIAGILLGPSAIGRSAVFENYLFAKSSLGILKTFADIGLIVFMFLVGLELDANILKRNARNSVLISVVAMVLPFGLGLAASLAVYNTQFEDGAQPPFSSFLLFVAVALSITAFPVLARILAETRMLDDRVGNIALSSAAVDDVVAWCLLALVVAIARATNPLTALWTFMALFGFIAFMLFGMRRLLIRVARKSRQNQSLKLHVIALFLGLMLLCAWFTEIIGVHSIFGAFLLGVITPRENRFALDITERIEDLVVILLLPLYFTYSGLNTDLGSINNALTGGLTVLIIVTACAGKIIGATLAAKFCKNTWRESFTVGILMNTKGLVELIVLNLGLQVGVLNQKIFTMFVVMAIVTTCITTPLVHFIYLRHRKLNAHPKENYQLVLFSADQKTSMDMVGFAAVTSPPNTSTIKAVIFNEISDRPSSYFFHLSNKLRNDVPFFKDKTKKDLLHTVKKAGQRAGVAVRTKVLNSVHVGEDVARTANNYVCDMILIGINSHVEEPNIGVLRQTDGLKKSVSEVFEVKFDQFVGAESPSGAAILECMKDVPTPLGVFISKISGPVIVRRVPCYYAGKEHEHTAIDVLLKMRKEVEVDVFTTKEQADSDTLKFSRESHPNINVQLSESPTQELRDSLRDRVYDLAIVSSQRTGANAGVIDLIKDIPVNILVVFPALLPNNVPFRSDIVEV